MLATQVSGRCIVSGTKVAVIGGSDGDDTLLNVVDVIDVSALDDDQACESIPYLPLSSEDMTAAFLGNKLYACGGRDPQGSSSSCHVLDEDLLWAPMEPLPDVRQDSVSSVGGGVWWITGGARIYELDDFPYEEIEVYNTTLVFDGVNMAYGPTMPTTKTEHCQLTLDDERVFVGGGAGDTWTFDWQTREWTILADMPDVLFSGACGSLNNPELGREVLVASGYGAFFYNFERNEWREGPPLPEKIEYVSYAQLDDGFLAIGGAYRYPDLSVVDTIYKFSEDTYEWTLLEQRLSEPRKSTASAVVSEEFLYCG